MTYLLRKASIYAYLICMRIDYGSLNQGIKMGMRLSNSEKLETLRVLLAGPACLDSVASMRENYNLWMSTWILPNWLKSNGVTSHTFNFSVSATQGISNVRVMSGKRYSDE